MLDNKKQVYVVIFSVIVLCFAVIGTSYSSFVTIGDYTNNKVINDFPIISTFVGDNSIQSVNVVDDSVAMGLDGINFSVVNDADLPVVYTISIKNNNTTNISDLKYSIDSGKVTSLSDIESNDNEYVIYTGSLRNKNDMDDVATHNIRLWSNKPINNVDFDIKIKGNTSNDILIDKIETLSHSSSVTGINIIDDSGITEDAFGNIRYFGSNPNNYIELDGSLWRIIGIFNEENSYGRNVKKIKIIKNEPVGAEKIPNNLYSLNDKVANNTLFTEDNVFYRGLFESSNYRASDFYDKEFGIDATYSKIGLLNLSDYYYASMDDTTGNWLTSEYDYWVVNVKNDSTGYYVNSDGSIESDSLENSHNIRPVTYLKSTVILEKGNGTIQSPYVVK